MSSERLDIMECHCHGGRQLKKYTLIDDAIDLVTFLATLLFITLLHMNHQCCNRGCTDAY